MGNHEFCTECGESSFHLGLPCNPERKAAYKTAQDESLERGLRAQRAAKAMVENLNARGIPAKLNHEYGYKIEISGLDLVDTQFEPTY